MSKETFVFIVGFFVFITSFLGIPREYKEWIFIGSGILLMIVGYQLRRAAFLKSLELESGERTSDVFTESPVVSVQETSLSKENDVRV